MKKFVLGLTVMIGLMSNLSADRYWDCSTKVEKLDWYGWLYGYDSTITLEITARNRSQAVSNAIYNGRYMTKGGLFGGGSIYVCPKGHTKDDDGKKCKYRFYEADCYSQ